MTFQLDSRLEADTIPIGDLSLSSVLLLNDARFPWFVLVPRVPNASEITDLSEEQSIQLMQEIRIAARVMVELSKPDKVNVGALGNIVTQLHVHVIGRFRDVLYTGTVDAGAMVLTLAGTAAVFVASLLLFGRAAVDLAKDV